MVQEEDKLLKFFEALQIVIEIVISKFLPDLANIESNFGNKFNDGYLLHKMFQQGNEIWK